MKFEKTFTPACTLLFFSLLLFSFATFAQDKITGKVISETDLNPLAGATISIKGTAIKTYTDKDGLFNINVNARPVVIVVSYVGFRPEEIKLAQNSSILKTVILHGEIPVLNQVVVTAGRTKQPLSDVPQKIELISAKDIAYTPALDVTDILKKTAAVDVIQYPGILSGIGIRGFKPQYLGLTQHTLLLINGRPAGTTNLGTLDLNFIDHIEVLKGPASALYGSNAMGGVVNIITPQTTGDIRGNFYADYGTYNTTQFGVKAGGNITKRLDFDLAETFFDRNTNYKMGNGHLLRNLFNGNTATEIYANGTVKTVDDARGDGQRRPNTRYKYDNTSARIGYQLSNSWRADVSGTIFRANHVETPGDIFSGDGGAGVKNVLRNSGEAAVAGKLNNSNELSIRGYYANEGSDTYNIRTAAGAVMANPYLSFTSKYKWYGSQVKDAISFLGNQKIIVGYDYNNESSKTISQSAPSATTGLQAVTATAPNASIITNGFYAQGQFNLLSNKLKINPGVRLDLTEFKLNPTPYYTKTLFTGTQKNTFLSPSLSTQYNFVDHLAIHGSVGRAFVTPDALQTAGYQLSGTGTGKVAVSQGNPDLKNESSYSEDIGLKYENNRSGFSADVTYFNTNVKDRITSISAPPNPSYKIGNDVVTTVTNYYNANKSKIRGMEYNISYDFGALDNFRYSLRTFANVTQSIKAQDITVSTTGVETYAAIQNVAKANVNLGIEYGNNRNYNIRLTGRFVGHRYDTDFNDPLRPLVYYPKFAVLDAAGSYSFNKHHQLTLFVNNLTDENYYEKRGYSQPGRTLRLRYTYNFYSLFKKH